MNDAGRPASAFPLYDRFPALRHIPRLELARLPTPVEPVRGDDAPLLWIKRDDLTAPTLGGNKVRSLEFLLAGVGPGDEVVTIGGWGSTHVLATAHYAARLGARTTVVRWRQALNESAGAVRAEIDRSAGRSLGALTAVDGFLRGQLQRRRRRVRWVPAGGTSPLGILGHVNAGLELAAQIERGEFPPPTRIYIPLGSGGTAAGVALGLALAPVDVEIVAVRVVPWVVANAVRVRTLLRQTRRLIERECGTALSIPQSPRVRVVHTAYGGAYGRATEAGRLAAARLRKAHRVGADATYAAKALAVALAERGEGVSVFWLTFDARWMTSAGSHP